MIKSNSNTLGGWSSRYCFFSTCLHPTLLHLWRSCALKLVHPLCCDALWILPYRFFSDRQLSGGLPSWLYPQMAGSSLSPHYSPKLHVFTESQSTERTVCLSSCPRSDSAHTHTASPEFGRAVGFGGICHAKWKTMIVKVFWNFLWLKPHSLSVDLGDIVFHLRFTNMHTNGLTKSKKSFSFTAFLALLSSYY